MSIDNTYDLDVTMLDVRRWIGQARRELREADAALAEANAKIHEDMLAGCFDEREATGHRAIAVALRALAKQIRRQP